MTRATGLISILLAVGMAACNAGDPIDDEWEVGEGGKADDASRDSGTIFFVYDNHQVCITAPCPSYTLVTPGAVSFEVARVAFEPGAEQAAPLLTSGGVLVHGKLESGTWNPGDKGPGLTVDEALEEAKPYLVTRHSGDTGAPYAVVNADGVDHAVHRIDMEGFVPDDDECTLPTLVTGDWAAKGFLGHSDTGESVLFVTHEAGMTMPYRVAASGIECVTWPCPIWSLTSMEGEPVGTASRIELGYLQLSDKETAAIEQALFVKGGVVSGWLQEQVDNDDVMLVVQLGE